MKPILRCPRCREVFHTNTDLIEHLVKDERLTEGDLYDRMVTVGLLSRDEIESYIMEKK